MAKIIINGAVVADGDNITILGDKVYVDGKDVSSNIGQKLLGDISISGDVETLTTDRSVTCKDVTGDIRAGGNVICDSIYGDIQTNGNVSCDDVSGDILASGNVSAKDVIGNVTAHGNVTCHSISPDVSSM